jgi:hypothetical protein
VQHWWAVVRTSAREQRNLLTPRIQGHAPHVHPIIVLLAVIGGGQIGGLAGVIFAVPILAVLRVLFDFFRACIRTKSELAPQDALLSILFRVSYSSLQCP